MNKILLLLLLLLIIGTEALNEYFNKKNDNDEKTFVYVNYLSKNNNSNTTSSIIFYELLLFENNNESKLIELSLNSELINNNAVFHYINESFDEQKLVKVSNEQEYLYHGKILNETDSSVALSNYDGLRGFIQIGDRIHFIEPLKNDLNNKHVIWPQIVFNKKLTSRRRINKRDQKEDTLNMFFKERTIETLIVADHLISDEFKKLNENLETYLLSVFNMVSLIFKDQSLKNPIKFSLVRILILENQTAELEVETDPVKTLISFSEFQKNLNYPDLHPLHHDLAILVTQKDFCSEIDNNCDLQGLANKGTICVPELSANINQNDGLSLAFTIAHEIGHNLNADHDQADCLNENQHTIMKPYNDHDNSFKTWSKCSQKAINEFLDKDLNGKCLENDPQTQLINETTIMLPGLIYSLDKQCQLSNGINSSFCENPENSDDENVCQKLWCRIDGEQGCSVNNAIAEGTPCNKDGDYWCFRGRCVKIGNSSDESVIDGDWSEWSDWSECTHECNGGVQFRERKCNNPPPSYYGKFCSGESKSYRMCNMQDCKKKEDLFQRQNKQCIKYSKQHEFDKNTAKDLIYYFDAKTPCKLLCSVNDYIYEIAKQVDDGTRCMPESNDVCINGECQSVGCDFVLNSNLVNDLCGVCNGTNSTCLIEEKEIFFNQAKKKNSGYNYLFTLPKGARNIFIKNDNVKNYLSLKDSKKYYLNGDYKIQYSRIFNIDKVKVNYSRIEQETISINGPIKASLQVMFLYLDKNSNISYVYAIDNNTEAESPYWITEEWSNTCSINPCKNETRIVKCSNTIEGGTVSDLDCDISEKPEDQRKCPMAENVLCKKKIIEAFDVAYRSFKETFLSLINKVKN